MNIFTLTRKIEIHCTFNFLVTTVTNSSIVVKSEITLSFPSND